MVAALLSSVRTPLSILTALVLCASCGGSKPPAHNEPLSAEQHEAEARRHEAEAREHDKTAASLAASEESGEIPRCLDQPLAGQPTSGTERLQLMRPCWTSEQAPSATQRREAKRDREAAAEHRRMAATLRRAEAEACSGLGVDEISHSPFHHTADILAVEAVKKGKELLGARVTFRKVPGLDAAWMRKAVTCHQARAAALGYDPSEMPYCPLHAGPTDVDVEDLGDAVVVTVKGKNDLTAAIILGRANDLVAPAAPPPQ
jgi:hypothetical protein